MRQMWERFFKVAPARHGVTVGAGVVAVAPSAADLKLVKRQEGGSVVEKRRRLQENPREKRERTKENKLLYHF